MYTSNRPLAPGVKDIPTSPPKVLKNSLATHVAVAWCCHATQYRISTRTFHSPFVAMFTLLTSGLLPYTNTRQRCQAKSYSTHFSDDVKQTRPRSAILLSKFELPLACLAISSPWSVLSSRGFHLPNKKVARQCLRVQKERLPSREGITPQVVLVSPPASAPYGPQDEAIQHQLPCRITPNDRHLEVRLKWLNEPGIQLSEILHWYIDVA
jgi:hypothetical protein